MIYRASKALGLAVLSGVFRWEPAGQDNIPSSGPVIICSNHISWWDPVAIGCACPRNVRFMAKEELFRDKVFGSYLRALGAFPVRRGKPDRVALRTALGILSEGGVLGMFPEGTRSRTGELGKPEPGAAVIAIKSGAPVVPAAIVGVYRAGGRVKVRFGKPFLVPPDLGSSGESILEASRLIMEHIARLRDEALERT